MIHIYRLLVGLCFYGSISAVAASVIAAIVFFPALGYGTLIGVPFCCLAYTMGDAILNK